MILNIADYERYYENWTTGSCFRCITQMRICETRLFVGYFGSGFNLWLICTVNLEINHTIKQVHTHHLFVVGLYEHLLPEFEWCYGLCDFTLTLNLGLQACNFLLSAVWRFPLTVADGLPRCSSADVVTTAGYHCCPETWKDMKDMMRANHQTLAAKLTVL